MTDSDMDSRRAREICDHIEAISKHLGNGLAKLAMVRKDNEYDLHSASVTFLKKGENISDERWDYGELVLVRKQLSTKSVCKLLREIAADGMLGLKGVPQLKLKGTFEQDLEFIPSRRHYGYFRPNPWPTRYSRYRIEGALRLPRRPLVSLDYPLYPDGLKALASFLGLSSAPDRSILVQIPDYRVRITELNIARSRMKLRIESSIGTDPIMAKFYGESGEASTIYPSYSNLEPMCSPSFGFRDSVVEYEFEKEPKYVLALVFDQETDETLDYRGFHFDWPSQDREGITFELDPLEIREIVRRGENLNVEFKQDLTNSEEFLESVVAFANTKGGAIFLGVSDDARLLGFQPKSRDQIANLIASNVEPALKYRVVTTDIGDAPITVVEVPEGENKPYSHKQLGVYVRSGSTDRRAIRTDLDEIYERRRVGMPL